MIAIAAILINIVVLSLLFDFYYDLNDDCFMRDIMSGSYTGTPDGHNVQTLYVLGAFISLFYRLCRPLPWYGVFLIFCQFGSLYAVGARLLRFCHSISAKIGCMVIYTLFLWGVILSHMNSLHYTFISAMMAASAMFLFLTTPKGLTAKKFVVQNIPSVLLVILAYQLRTEILLLLFPFICLAGLFRWSEEEKFFEKENYIKYGIVLGCIAAGMLGSRAIDLVAYGSGEWKQFLTFFNERTEVYDYHAGILTDEEYLHSIGVSDAQMAMFSNYNFGLDENINAELMGEIADHARENTDYAARIPDAVRQYIYRTLHSQDMPYNGLVIVMYCCIVLAGIYGAFTGAGWSFLWKLILTGMVRTSLWMFILVRGRYPERITHSLYIAEAVLLLGVLCMQLVKLNWMRFEQGDGEAGERGSKAMPKGVFIICALISLLCICYLPRSVKNALSDEEYREGSHDIGQVIAQYCRSHPENYYFKDVYSTVGASQKIFQDVDNGLANHDIMGGWLCKSPLYDEKMGQFGITSMEEGLLYHENVYFIAGKNDDTTWLLAHYAGKGIAVSVEQADSLSEFYAVYRVKEIDG